MMIQITLHVQSSEPAFNALQFPISFMCHQLHLFTNHCISPTLLLQTAFLLPPSISPVFPKKNNTQTTATMSSDSSSTSTGTTMSSDSSSSSTSTGTTMSSDSSSVISKVSLKLFRIYIKIMLTIFDFVLFKF